MNELSTSVSEAIKHFGRNFIVAALLPAAILVLANVYLLLPVWLGQDDLSWSQNQIDLPLVGTIDLANFAGLVLLSLLGAILLAGLNSTLIRILEGKYWWQRYGLLLPFFLVNRWLWRKRYGSLAGLRREYFNILVAWPQEAHEQGRKELGGRLIELRHEIDKAHRKVEAKRHRQSLPHTEHRLTPTAFGNAYAIVEEYSYERYGIDSVLFWPRLQVLIEKEHPGFGDKLSYLTGSLDLTINLFFVSLAVVCEIALTLWFLPASRTLSIFTVTGTSLLFCIAFYQASVAAVYSLGEVVVSAFDFHRNLLLHAYKLRKPHSLGEEQRLWIKLATFIRRGDDFYFPAEFAAGSPNSGDQNGC